MLLEIQSGEIPSSTGPRGVFFQIDTDLVASVGPLDADEIYAVKMKDGRDYKIRDSALPRSQFMTAWEGTRP